MLHDSHAWAVGLFAYAGVTDLLDGWIARKWNRKTVVGTVIDPMADKALMTILTVCLAAKGALPCTCRDDDEYDQHPFRIMAEPPAFFSLP